MDKIKPVLDSGPCRFKRPSIALTGQTMPVGVQICRHCEV
jgi:hypothetical protein